MMSRIRTVGLALLLAVTVGCEDSQGETVGSNIRFYRLRGPGDGFDIGQGSDLCYGRLGERAGLWVVSDRNGGESAGRLFYFSAATLNQARHGDTLVADEMFTVLTSDEEWSKLAAGLAAIDEKVLADLRRRIESGQGDRRGAMLDLEAVAIGPSPTDSDKQRVFVAAEEPFSLVLELKLEDGEGRTDARLMGVYAYNEAPDEHGTDHNDGIEGLAYDRASRAFFWVEEGTRFHDGPPGPRLFFLEPRLGTGELRDGRLRVDEPLSEKLTAAVRSRRDGKMQTLNAVTVAPDGRVLAVDRNGGWILEVDPKRATCRRWLNLYDLNGTNLREALAEFPGERRMSYISIEGIAVDPSGGLWLVDDPAMPEGFRGSCLVHIKGEAKRVSTKP